jgi:hypothetical protein
MRGNQCGSGESIKTIRNSSIIRNKIKNSSNFSISYLFNIKYFYFEYFYRRFLNRSCGDLWMSHPEPLEDIMEGPHMKGIRLGEEQVGLADTVR